MNNAQNPLPFRRVLLKISGEVLMGTRGFGLDFDVVTRIVSEIIACGDLGIRFGLVVGGGNFCRGLSLASTHAGLDRARSDDMGMLATVMNALALEQVFSSLSRRARVFSAISMPKICDCFDRRRALCALEEGEYVIFAGGTGNPYFTTDTAGALRALEIGADLFLKGTSVDGVYTSDPKTDKDAAPIPHLSYQDLLVYDLKVMDAAAVSLARGARLPVGVFSIRTPGALQRTLILGEGASFIDDTGDASAFFPSKP